jgi:tungstate transport system permease protein
VVEQNAFATALGLVTSLDPDLLDVVGLSLRVSLTAVLAAMLIGLPLGALLALARFPGRNLLIILFNALMGLPPVVAGPGDIPLLSRSGPLGAVGLLFTPTAMVIAQAVLVVPIVVSLTRQTVADLWAEYEISFVPWAPRRCARSQRFCGTAVSAFSRRFLAGFGRASAEVGAVLIVGGNIAGVTRTMTTSIALETSRGDLAMALGLGVVLLAITLLLNAGAYLAGRWAAARGRLAMHGAIPLPLLRLDAVSFAVRGQTLVGDLSFQIQRGRRTIFLGANGAGKTLTLRLCHGLLRPSSGRVVWQERMAACPATPWYSNGRSFCAARRWPMLPTPPPWAALAMASAAAAPPKHWTASD